MGLDGDEVWVGTRKGKCHQAPRLPDKRIALVGLKRIIEVNRANL